MARFLGRRLAAAAVLLWLVLTGTFALAHLAPGEPSLFYDRARLSLEARAELRRLYGLDRPLAVQYVHWLGAAAQGRWGTSFTHGRPVMDLIAQRLPATALLVAAGLLLEHLAGLALGIWAARHPDRPVDRWARLLAMVITATPIIVLGPLLIEFLAVRWQFFPPQQMSSGDVAGASRIERLLDVLHHLALPALTLAAARFGSVFRFVRNGMLEILGQDYIRNARALGIGEGRILWRHALPNCLGALIQRLGVSLPLVFSSTLILEVIFAWPGLGHLAYVAVQQRDYPLIMAVTAFGALLVVVCGLAADLGHAWLDPRLREHHA